MMIKIVFIVYVILINLVFFFVVRNSKVYEERGRMIDWVFSQEDWQEKRKLLKSPSYNEMILKFWKPVKSFYKDYLN